jgi:ketosteroid isomerase-like protein
MRSLIAFIAVFVMSVIGIAAQPPSAAEQQIRDQIAKLDATPATPESRRDLYMKDAVFWSNAYSKPHSGDEPLDAVRADMQAAPGRRNQMAKTSPKRIIVAKGGDMAHEYSTFRLSFDDDKGHSDLEGAVLRVWQLQEGRWRIAAEFRRPYGRVVPAESQKSGK